MAQQGRESQTQHTKRPSESGQPSHSVQPRGDIERRRSGGQNSIAPLAFTRRFLDDVDQLFGEFFGLAPLTSGGSMLGSRQDMLWSPQIEVFQREHELVVRAELPGVKKDDVNVELNEDMLTIEGRREQQSEDRRGQVYHSERSYGSFMRTIPLPEGVIGESANATFKDGVLEIVMQAPPAHQQSKGRKLEIKGGDRQQQSEQKPASRDR